MNCAALTGVKPCADDPLLASIVNGALPRTLGATYQGTGIPVVHFSTEAVHDDTVYGNTKRNGEHPSLCIYRLPQLYGPTHDSQIVGRLVNALLRGERVKVASDIISYPIYTPHLANFIVQAEHKPGLSEVTGPRLSLHGLILAIAEGIGLGHLVDEAKAADFGDTPKTSQLSGRQISDGPNDYIQWIKDGLPKAA